MSVIINNSRLFQNGIKRTSFQNGSSVLVRINSDKGNGVYEGFVAGTKVTIHSKNPLKTGSNFTAAIWTKNGNIYVTPKNLNSEELLITESSQFDISEIEEQALSRMLSNLGVASDSVSVNIIRQLHQMEMKYDVDLISKVKNLAIKISGKEKKAAELLLMLLEKEISFSDAELINLLNLLEEKLFDNDDNDFELLNNINRKKGHWFIVPFNFVQINDDSIDGSGVIRLLYINNKIKQINVDSNYDGTIFLFNLIFEAGKCQKIYYYCDDEKKREVIENELNKRFYGKIEMEEGSVEKLEGSGSENEKLFTVGGNI